MATVMTKKEFMALSKADRTKAVKKSQRKARRPRQQRQRQGVQMPGPARNGSGRKRGQRRQRGGNIANAGNTREFRIPIDEDVGNLNGSAGFLTGTYALNPGNPLLFPFLSRIAQNYERYEFESLVFHYKPSVSGFATQGQQGFVGICATMDIAQAQPNSQQQADIMYHAPVVETSFPTNLKLPKSFLQCKSVREKFFVRQNGNIPGGNDPHTYDCGQVFVWVNGQTNMNQVGLFRVTGSVKLSNPALDFGVTASALPNYTVSLFSVVNAPAAATGAALSIPFTTVNFNNLNITQDGTSSIFTLPPGNFMVDFSGDTDLSGAGAATGLFSQYQLFVNGLATSPVVSTVCPISATNTLPLHAAGSLNWFVRSNGATTVTAKTTSNYTAGVADVDAMIRFTAI
jgi:hypothetical protein